MANTLAIAEASVYEYLNGLLAILMDCRGSGEANARVIDPAIGKTKPKARLKRGGAASKRPLAIAPEGTRERILRVAIAEFSEKDQLLA